MNASAASGLTIERLGSDGDGMARTPDGRLAVVPFALPGETIVDGVMTVRSPERAEPPCPHFTVCGGCLAQHMGDTLYAAWKRDLVVQALRQHRIDTDVAPLVRVHPASRRRAAFSLLRTDSGLRLAFHKRRDSAMLALDTCLVVTPRIAAALPKLAALATRIPAITAETRLAVADLTGGLDVLVEGASAKLTAEQRSWLAAKAGDAGIARLTIGRDTIVEHAAVSLPGPAGALAPHPGAFFQAVADAEAAIIAAVVAGLPKKSKHIADLFAGIGTLTLPLARAAPVFAADSEKPALACLADAVRHAQGLKPVATRYRDLFGEPLSVKELSAFDVVVLDPPRAGAKAQCDMLAQSKVKTAILVSCNPQTLARDARTLIDGGYALQTVTPIDQFLWSNHVEAVAVFRR